MRGVRGADDESGRNIVGRRRRLIRPDAPRRVRWLSVDRFVDQLAQRVMTSEGLSIGFGGGHGCVSRREAQRR